VHEVANRQVDSDTLLLYTSHNMIELVDKVQTLRNEFASFREFVMDALGAVPNRSDYNLAKESFEEVQGGITMLLSHDYHILQDQYRADILSFAVEHWCLALKDFLRCGLCFLIDIPRAPNSIFLIRLLFLSRT
jgi:hypothetical protein